MTRLVQLSDLHVFADPDARLFGVPTRELLTDVVRHVREHAGVVDHVVVTGDLTHDELGASYATVREVLEPWLDRLWLVPGNHDERMLLRSAFADRIGGAGSEPVRFAFAPADGWLCLGLDTHVPGAVPGLFDASQAGWLGQQLAAHDAADVIVFLHHPPVDVGAAWLDHIGLAGRDELLDLLAADGRVRLVSAGHVHHETATKVGSIEVVTMPSAGLQMAPGVDRPTFARAAPGYRVIELTGRTWSTHVVRLPEARYTPEQPPP